MEDEEIKEQKTEESDTKIQYIFNGACYGNLFGNNGTIIHCNVCVCVLFYFFFIL